MKFSRYFFTLLCLFCSSILFSSSALAILVPDSAQTPDIQDAATMSYYGLYKDQLVKLTQGQWTGLPFVKGGSSRPTAGLIKNFSFTGDINADGIAERVVFLWESSGGSGTRIFMAVIGKRNGRQVNLATQLVGDRVQLRMGRVYQGNIELDVVQAGESDAACCPTSKVFRSWSLINDNNNTRLIENTPIALGTISLADLRGVEWTLLKMNWQKSLPAGINITLNFDSDKVSGQSGCNRYFATAKAGKQPAELTISQAGTTRRACDAEIMKLESRYLNALAGVTDYHFVNGQLALTWKSGDANSTMLFTARKIKEKK